MIYHLFRQIGYGIEHGFYIESSGTLSDAEMAKLRWLIAETFEAEETRPRSSLTGEQVVEVGPRLTIETPFSPAA